MNHFDGARQVHHRAGDLAEDLGNAHAEHRTQAFARSGERIQHGLVNFFRPLIHGRHQLRQTLVHGLDPMLHALAGGGAPIPGLGLKIKTEGYRNRALKAPEHSQVWKEAKASGSSS